VGVLRTSSRVWQILATIILLSQPAWGAGFMDPATFERDNAAGNALMDQWIKCTQVAAGKLAGSSGRCGSGGCRRIRRLHWLQERFYQLFSE